jgi:hypothetical protein
VRPPGKRSNPDYVQLTCYVREENLDDAKEALMQEGTYAGRHLCRKALMQEKRETGRKRDVSDVIDSLLAFYAERGDLYKILRDGRG